MLHTVLYGSWRVTEWFCSFNIINKYMVDKYYVIRGWSWKVDVYVHHKEYNITKHHMIYKYVRSIAIVNTYIFTYILMYIIYSEWLDKKRLESDPVGLLRMYNNYIVNWVVMMLNNQCNYVHMWSHTYIRM